MGLAVSTPSGQVRSGHESRVFLTFEYVADFLCALTKLLLKPADKLVILSLGIC